MTVVSVLRVRPASQQHQGLDLNDLVTIVQTADLGGVREAREFRVPGTEVEAPVLQKLEAITAELLAESDVLAVDMGFDFEDGREYLYGWLFASAIRLLPSAFWENGKHVIVLTQEEPQANSELYDFIVDADWRARVSFAAIVGSIPRSRGPFASAVGHMVEEARKGLAARSAEFDALETAQSLFLRRRGVFRMDKQANSGYFKFHYDTGFKGSEALASRLESYLIERDIRVVVFNSLTAAHWFFDAVHGACASVRRSGLEIAWLDEAYIDKGLNLVDSAGDTWREETDRAFALLDAPDAAVCFVSPAIDRARSLRAMRRKFKSRGEVAVNLAILVNSKIRIGSLHQMNCGAYSGIASINARQNGRRLYEDLPLDFLFRVEIDPIPQANWKVRAAETLIEVEYPRGHAELDRRVDYGEHAGKPFDSVTFSVPAVSMWSLYEDYGVTIEPMSVVPHVPARKPIQRYPRLDELSPWDAHWLAEAVTRAFEDTLGLDRTDFAVLLPDEATGTAPIAEAMDRRCGVAVVRVPRAVIDGEVDLPVEVYDEIGDWKGDELVVFDESSITGGTLINLASLVQGVTGDVPAALAVIVDLRPPGRGSPKRVAEALNVPADRAPVQFSLQRWAAGWAE